MTTQSLTQLGVLALASIGAFANELDAPARYGPFGAGPIPLTQQGDNMLPGNTPVDPQGLAYSLSDLIGYIGAVWGPEAQSQVQMAVDACGPNGVGELPGSSVDQGQLGGHDGNTIGIATGVVPDPQGGEAYPTTKAQAASRLMHEAIHRNRVSGGSVIDPYTSSGLHPGPGDCRHANMHYDAVVGAYCNSGTPAELAALCGMLQENMTAAEHWRGKCNASMVPDPTTDTKVQQAQSAVESCCSL